MPPNGEIMLRDAVQINKGRAYTVISRSNGRREIEVAANVTPPVHGREYYPGHETGDPAISCEPVSGAVL